MVMNTEKTDKVYDTLCTNPLILLDEINKVSDYNNNGYFESVFYHLS
jgi:ATP-dependent Lon protease